MKNSNKQSFLTKGSVAKRLALMTLFGVGFVLPGLNNMALANYGEYVAGGIKADGATGLLTGCNKKGITQSLSISDFSGMGESQNAYWAKNKTDRFGGNYVVLTGIDSQKYTFKVMEYSSSNSTSGVVTLWNYGLNDDIIGTGSVNGRFGYTNFGANSTYSTSKLREFMTGSVARTLSNYTGAMVAYTASGAAAGESINGAAANGDLIWAPSTSEVAALGNRYMRADGGAAWLRSYYFYNTSHAYVVDSYGYFNYYIVSLNYSVRPALQLKIASINPIAFTSNAANITATTMTTGNAGSCEYGVDGSKTATFTTTNGVILDNLSISVTADGGGYATAGLLTTNTGATWSDISGDISYMAIGTTFDLTNADTTDRVLRIFGVDDTNKKVTELASGAVQGLSKGTDNKIHMQVSTTVNAGVPVTLKNGAVVDMVGHAGNNITVGSGDSGVLNLGTNNYMYFGSVTDAGTLTVQGMGTMLGTVSGAGKIVVDGTVSADANIFTQTGGLEVKDSDDILNLTAGTLSKDVTNSGTVKMNGATLDGAHVTTGTLEFAKDISANADYVAATTNKIDTGVTLELTAGTLSKDVTNSGTVKLNGATMDGAHVTTGTLEFAKDLTLNADYVVAEINTVDAGVILTLSGGNLIKSIVGEGNVVITAEPGSDTLVINNADSLNNIKGEVNVESGKSLTLKDGTLSKDIDNEGTVVLEGATMDSERVKEGTIEFAKDLTINGEYISNAEKVIDENVNLTVNGGTLTNNIAGDGTLTVPTGAEVVYEQTNNSKISVKTIIEEGGKLDPVADDFDKAVENHGTLVLEGGNLNVQVTNYANTSTMEVIAPVNMAEGGKVIQQAGSDIVVPVTVIESDANTVENALFGNITSANQLDVKDGNLIVAGQVTDGQYYVLAEGTAVAAGTVKAADLWKKENIALNTSNYFLADYDYVISGNAIAVKVQAATVEEANTSGLAAVQQGNMAVAKEFTGEVESHLGMIATPKLAEKDKYDKEVWASYIRTKETTEGMKLGAGVEGNNTAQYNGAVVGVDFYSSKKAVTGLAISYTTGDIDSYSGTTFTRNKSKYYGVSFYDRVTNGNTALIYDIGYIKGDNDISQFYTGQEITADVKTDTYTAGVRYEAEFGTKASRVVPFASFRYMRQNNKDYTNSHNTRFEAKNQNLYIPKVGIAWTGDFAMPQCEWTWRPSVEAGYVWNLGDRSVDSNIFMGANVAPLEYDVVDKSSYYAKAGMEFMTKNFTAGVFYRYLKGNAVKNNKWNINMAWSF